jgi:peptidoglycan/xylan/chitin deacetylase (PgdA/CDA1 family)
MMHAHNKMMRPHNKGQQRDLVLPVPPARNHWRPRDWIKLGLATTVEASGLFTAFRALRTLATGARIHVLGYHRVVDAIERDGVVNPSLCITADAFRRQMEQLRRRFDVLPLADVARALAGDLEVPRDAACVTFDDGYRDVILRAQPIMRELGIPATVFVPTGFAGASGPARFLPHDRLYAALALVRQRRLSLAGLVDTLTPDEPPPDGSAETLGQGRAPWHASADATRRAVESALLLARLDRILAQEGAAAAVEAMIRAISAATLGRAIAALEARLDPPALDDGAAVLAPAEVHTLADAGWEIGAHTIGHVVLTHEPLAEARRQIVASKHDLERWSGRPCRFFAYCNGFHSPAVVDELRRAGYEAAVTTCDRPNVVGASDPFRITRKILWEAHARGPHGRFSPALSGAHLHDLFGLLRLTTPLDGHMVQAHHEIVQLHNKERATSADVVQAHNKSDPAEVKLAY